MSESLPLAACQKKIEVVLEVRNKLYSQQLIPFADCQRLCDRCSTFNDSRAVLHNLKETELEALGYLFEKIRGFVMKVTKRSHFRDMLTAANRDRCCQEFAALNESLQLYSDEIFRTGVPEKDLQSNTTRKAQWRKEDIEVCFCKK